MTATELRALAERLLAVEPHDYEDRPALESAADVLELLAWQTEKRIGIIFVLDEYGSSWAVFGEEYEGDTPISTLRRAREASKS